MGRPKDTPPQHGIMLRTRPPGRDLDLYIFADTEHARAWLSQPFVTDDKYQVALCTYKERPGCGERYAIKPTKIMRVSTWLAQQAEAQP